MQNNRRVTSPFAKVLLRGLAKIDSDLLALLASISARHFVSQLPTVLHKLRYVE